MKMIWFWVVAGMAMGFWGLWAVAAAGVAGLLGCALLLRGGQTVYLVALVAGLCSGVCGATIHQLPFSGGTVMEVVEHTHEKGRIVHQLKRGTQKVRRELSRFWAPGSPVWVPDDPRLPALPLPGAIPTQHILENQPQESFINALTLGSLAPAKLRTQLRHAGLAHVLALSGLHLAIVTWMVLLITKYLHYLLPQAWYIERRLFETIVGIAFAWSYQVLTGAHVSTTRAACMLTFWLLFTRFWGVGSLFSNLFLTASLLWMWDPDIVYDPAFQLSFAAVAGIGLAQPVAPKTRGWNQAVISVGATLATFPIVWWHFGRISPMFLINNLIFLPVFSLILIPCAFIVKAIAIIIPHFGDFLHTTFDALALPMTSFMEWWNSLWPEWTTTGSVLWTLVLGIAVVVGARFKGRMGILLVVSVVMALWVLPFGRMDTSQLRLTFLAAGGESTLIRFPHGENWLIDAGTPGLIGQLAKRGVVHVHRVIVSHHHADHMQELFRLTKTINVDEVWVGPRFPTAWKQRLESTTTRVRPIPRSTPIPGGSVHLRSLHDGETAYVPTFWSENDASLVLELKWRGRSLWFLGDIEHTAERVLMHHCIPQTVDILKVPHHGRATSTGPDLCTCLRPHTAVICGGPADPSVLRRLQRTGAKIVYVKRFKEIAIEPCNILNCVWHKN